MINILAHAGEDHGNAVESTQHAIQISPLAATLIIVVIGVLVPLITYKLTKSVSAVIIISLVELLLIGILTYSFLPVLSAIALVLGFTLTLILVFSSM